jgi:peptidoglycan/LPS O-acetylase OafA/YrhL
MVILYFWVSIHALPDGRRLAGNLFFVDNVFSAFNGYNHNKGTSHLWSISLEEQYYFILPFFTLWLLKQKKKIIHVAILVIFTLLVLSKLIAIYFQFKHPFIYVLPISAECFFFGFILGLGNYNSYILKQNPFILFCSGIAFLILVYLLPSRQIIGYNQLLLYLFLALGFGLIFIAVVFGNSRIINLIFKNKVLIYLGKISFGLYIYHWLIIEKMTHYFKNTSYFIQLLGILMIFMTTFLIAVLSYELFEKRFLQLKKRFTVVKSREV